VAAAASELALALLPVPQESESDDEADDEADEDEAEEDIAARTASATAAAAALRGVMLLPPGPPACSNALL
jgi:hypothetical protein